jgi:hypothetical protein
MKTRLEKQGPLKTVLKPLNALSAIDHKIQVCHEKMQVERPENSDTLKRLRIDSQGA